MARSLDRAMDKELLDILRKYSVKPDTPTDFNFLSTWGSEDKWKIPQENLGNFWFHYCEYVQDRLVHDKPIKSSLCERAQPDMPMVVQFIFKFDNKPIETEYYGTDFILELVHIFQETLEEYLEISDQKKLYCVALENKIPTLVQGKNQIGLCLHFPFLKTEAGTLGRNILPNVLYKIREKGVSKRLTKKPLNDWEDIIVSMSCMRPIPLYASRKDPAFPSLTRNGLYGIVTAEQVINQSSTGIKIEEFFSPLAHAELGSEVKRSIQKSNDFWLPILLSTTFTSDVTKTRVIPQIKKQSSGSGDRNDPISLFEELCPHLSRKRVEERYYWLDVGRSIYNIYGGTTEGLEKWISLSEQSDIFGPEHCESAYYTLEGSANTIKTIAWFVQEDKPEWYAQWRSEKEIRAMDEALTAYDNDIANCLYEFYWLEFVCKDEKTWYQFKDHRWHLQRHGLGIKKLMSTELCYSFEDYRVQLLQSKSTYTENPDKLVGNTGRRVRKHRSPVKTANIDVLDSEITPADRDALKDRKIAKINKVIEKLKNNAFKKRLLSECVEFFGEVDYAYPFNANSELLGLTNGVIEICGAKAEFRPGKPEDYITKSTRIPLDESLSHHTPIVLKLKKYLGQVFVDRELGHHFLKLAASKLRGRNIHKILEVWTGDKGNNSKSMMVKLHERTFGDYFIKFPTEILTNKKNLGGPNPELAQAEGARIGCIQETSADKPMMPETIKQMTGGDSFFARNCCQDGGKIEAMYKTILMCNKVARVEGADPAIYDRLRLVPFSSQWVNNPPETEEEQYRQRLFKKVGDFEHQISDMAKAFLWLIYNYYKIYAEEGLIDPPCVVQVTENYWSETDPYNQFIEEHLKPIKNAKGEPDKTFSVSGGELFQAFSTWRKINYPGVQPPNCSTVTTNFTQRLGKPFNRRYNGYQLEFKSGGIPGSN